MISLIVGAIHGTECYDLMSVNYILDVAGRVLMVEIVNLLVAHVSAVPFTTQSPCSPSSTHITPPVKEPDRKRLRF